MNNGSRINARWTIGQRNPVPQKMSAEERFGSQVTVLPSGCWAFRNEVDEYHSFSNQYGQSMTAHRYAYKVLVGPVPKGFDVHHVCLNKGCVNPNHLEALSRADHAARHAQIRRECW